MSLLSDYEQRTAWKYAPICGSFHTAGGLSNKVNPDGSYAYFPGSTVTFRMKKKDLKLAQLMQQTLHRQLEGTNMLAHPLPASTLHMTLHDLLSPESSAYGLCDRQKYEAEMAESIDKAADIVAQIQRDFAGRRLVMVADRIVNMVSKSLVLMLRPQTEVDFELLLEMYRRFDEIVRLPYPLTPHITLAYFRPGMLDGERLGAAVDSAQISPVNAPVFEFEPEALTAQVFRNMQSYQDVPERICFCCDGGLNHSVMAANILNNMAEERGLPVKATARSAYRNTQDQPVPQEVWHTLESHGIPPFKTDYIARYLEDGEFAHFSSFAGLSEGAMDRFAWMGLPEERIRSTSHFFGVRDPGFGETSYEAAFADLRERVVYFLDDYESKYVGCGEEDQS